MAYGLYLHIPFCIKKCAYCDFVSAHAPEEVQAAYFSALRKEIANWKGKELDTVFLGGGTPSCVDARHIVALFSCIYEMMSVAKDAEITMEANPGTLTPENLQVYRDCGVNRISLGVQSFQNKELHALGRIHNAVDVFHAVDRIHSAGIENLNLDLMLATPYQTRASLHDTLEKAVSLSPAHISAYSLIVEPGTPFYEQQKAGQLPLPDEDLERDLCDGAYEFLQARGYMQYEISNYAKPGFACRHNLKYWQCMPYLGLGAAAHGYDGDVRVENTPDVADYIHRMNTSGTAVLKETSLSEEDKISEYIIMALRLVRGLDFSDFSRRFGFPFLEQYEDTIRKYERGGFFQIDSGRICFTQKGFAVSNAILADFV